MSNNETSEAEKLKQGRFIVFCLHKKNYGIPLAKVKEIIRPPMITPLPKVPGFYKGLINVRGQIISIIDMRLCLGMPEEKAIPKKTCVIISHVGDLLVGAIVDEIVDVTSYEESQISLEEFDRGKNRKDGVYAVAKSSAGDLTLLIDLEKTLEGTAFETSMHLQAS
ncbi:MAG: purine-binding chemotaxis protein CheW [Oligoflexales bacterium]|nr:purine-binding chemotaxis protein CheW [Oligoflexales bacterium]